MRALSLTEPWATLVAIEAKRIETRSWQTGYRGELLIHAAKNYPGWARALEQSFGDYSIGRFAWILDDVRRITPTPAKGALGLWKCELEVPA